MEKLNELVENYFILHRNLNFKLQNLLKLIDVKSRDEYDNLKLEFENS